MNLPPHITVLEAQNTFGVHSAQIYIWLKDGVLDGDKIGTGRIIWKDEKYAALVKERGVK